MDWTANTPTIAAVAQVVATVAAVIGLGLVWVQIAGANKSSDLRSLYSFAKDVREIEARLNDATGEAHGRVVYELLDFLEVTAAAERNNLFSKTTTNIVREKLIDTLAVMWRDQTVLKVLSEGTNGENFLEHVRQFIERHRSEVIARAEAQKQVLGQLQRNHSDAAEIP